MSWQELLEPVSKIGFWFKIPSSPREKRGFAGTRTAGPSFKPQVRLRRIEDLKRGTNPAEKGGRPKDIFEMGSSFFSHVTFRCSMATRRREFEGLI
jgi:hypothetical protein